MAIICPAIERLWSESRRMERRRSSFLTSNIKVNEAKSGEILNVRRYKSTNILFLLDTKIVLEQDSKIVFKSSQIFRKVAGASPWLNRSRNVILDRRHLYFLNSENEVVYWNLDALLEELKEPESPVLAECNSDFCLDKRRRLYTLSTTGALEIRKHRTVLGSVKLEGSLEHSSICTREGFVCVSGVDGGKTKWVYTLLDERLQVLDVHEMTGEYNDRDYVGTSYMLKRHDTLLILATCAALHVHLLAVLHRRLVMLHPFAQVTDFMLHTSRVLHGRVLLHGYDGKLESLVIL